MKSQFHKLKNLDYWLPIIFAIAIGTGLLVGVAIDMVWIGMILGILSGSLILFIFYKNKGRYN